jgi:hypothetical protein
VRASVCLKLNCQHVQSVPANDRAVELTVIDCRSLLKVCSRACKFPDIPDFSIQLISRFASRDVRCCARPEEAIVIASVMPAL